MEKPKRTIMDRWTREGLTQFPTRLGVHFGLIGLFAIIGGSLRGFNLMLILAGLIFGALLICWRWGRRSMDDLEVWRRLPAEAFAGEPFRVRHLIHNPSRLSPLRIVQLSDTVRCATGTLAQVQSSHPSVSAGGTSGQTIEVVVDRRGHFVFDWMVAATRYPLNLFESRQRQQKSQEFFVYPKLLPLRKNWRRRLRSQGGGVSTSVRRRGMSEGEFFGIRDWQPGDSPKWIHWRTTARLMHPAVKQFEQHRRFETCVLLDAFDSEDASAFESAVSLTASIVAALAQNPGDRALLAIAAQEAEIVREAAGPIHRHRLMQPLAMVHPSPQPALVDAIVGSLAWKSRFEDFLIISTRSMETTLLTQPEVMPHLSPWIRRGAVQWINVSNDLSTWVGGEVPRVGASA